MAFINELFLKPKIGQCSISGPNAINMVFALTFRFVHKNALVFGCQTNRQACVGVLANSIVGTICTGDKIERAPT